MKLGLSLSIDRCLRGLSLGGGGPSPPSGVFDSYYAPSFTAVSGKTLLTTPAQTWPATPSTGRANASYIDGRFGTRVYRPKSAAAFGVSKLVHSYSRLEAFNCDGSIFLLVGGTRHFLFNAATFAHIPGGKTDSVPPGAVGSNTIFPSDPTEYAWHPTDPNILYFKMPTGLIMYRYNVATMAVTVAWDLTSRLSAVGMGTATNMTMGGDGRPSRDGRYWGFKVVNGATQLGFICYDTVGDVLTGLVTSTGSVDNVTMSPFGTYVITAGYAGGTTTTDQAAAMSLASAAGVRAYSRDFTTFNQLSNEALHADTCIDTSGEEAYYGYAGQYFGQLAWGTFWVRKIASGAPTALYLRNEGTTTGYHMCGAGPPGWVIVSTYNDANNTETGWCDHDVFAIKAGLPFEARRIAHSRGGALASSYWDQPHATVSRDGTQVLFKSRFREAAYPTVSAYMTTEQESYLVGLPSWFYN